MQLAVGIDRAPNQSRSDVHTLVGNGVVGRGDLHRCQRDALSERNGGQLGAVELIGHHATGFVWNRGRTVSAGEPAKPQVEQVIAQPLRPHLFGDHDRSDVRRASQDLLDRQLTGTLVEGFSKGLVGVVVEPRHVEHGVWFDQVGFERSGDREHLVHRAGLVHVEIGHVVRRRAGNTGFGVALDPGRRQDLTRPGSHDDRDATSGFGRLDLLDQDLFSQPLGFAMDGEHEVLSTRGGLELVFARGQQCAVAATFVGLKTGLASEQFVVLEFEPRDRDLVGVDPADHPTSKVTTIRQEPRDLVFDNDALQAERQHLSTHFGFDLALDVHEPATGNDPFGDIGSIEVQNLGQSSASGPRVDDQRGVDPDGRPVIGHGQRVEVAIDNGTAVGNQRDAGLTLWRTPVGVGRRVEHLHID